MVPGDNNLLKTLRKQIDEVDLQIVDLLIKRMDIVDKVGAHKRQTGHSGCFLKPARENEILDNMCNKLRGVYPKEAVANIWRMIISSSLSREQEFSVNVLDEADHRGYWAAREYFGSFVPIKRNNSMSTIFSEIEKNDSAIGILPTDMIVSHTEKQPFGWWQGFNHSINIFGALPFKITDGNDLPDYLLVGKVLPEPTSNDRTFIRFSASTEVSKSTYHKLFNECDLEVEWIADHLAPGETEIQDHLLRIKGFIVEKDPRLDKLRVALDRRRASLTVIGAYSIPEYLYNK